MLSFNGRSSYYQPYYQLRTVSRIKYSQKLFDLRQVDLVGSVGQPGDGDAADEREQQLQQRQQQQPKPTQGPLVVIILFYARSPRISLRIRRLLGFM